jgi:hypothetical protein
MIILKNLIYKFISSYILNVTYKGSGPCLFCGALVCTNDEQEILNRGSKKSEQLRKKLIGDDVKAGKNLYSLSSFFGEWKTATIL